VLLVEVILPRLTEGFPMNIQQPTPMTPLRARMIADMSGRNLGPASQSSHQRACKRFAAWLGRSPETATPDDVKYFQQHLVESGVSICTRNQTMTGVKFLLRVTLRRHDLVAEIFHLKEPVKVPLVLSKNEIKRILAMAPSLKARVMLSLAYGCGMRAGEVVRLKVGDIDSAQKIIRIVQAKAAKIATSCCRPISWACCVSGGKSGPPVRTRMCQRLSGSSSPDIAESTSRRDRYRGCSNRVRRKLGSQNLLRCIHFVILSRPIYWNAASISG